MVLIQKVPFFTVYYDPATETSCGKKESLARKCSRRQFPIDLKETEASYVVYADLPGCHKDNVHIDFDDGERTLHILARSAAMLDSPTSSTSDDGASEKLENGTATERWLRRERPDLSATEWERYVELPKDAVAEQASASLTDGVLEVKIPRQHPKRYAIQVA